MGLFFNMDDSANRIFSEINSSYYSKSASYKAAVVEAPKTVAWINRATLALYGANAFEVSYAPYKVQYTQDAGGQVMSEAALGNMTDVLPSPVTNNTLWFTWDAMDVGLTGGFATEADAIAAFHSFLQTVCWLLRWRVLVGNPPFQSVYSHWKGSDTIEILASCLYHTSSTQY